MDSFAGYSDIHGVRTGPYQEEEDKMTDAPKWIDDLAQGTACYGFDDGERPYLDGEAGPTDCYDPLRVKGTVQLYSNALKMTRKRDWLGERR